MKRRQAADENSKTLNSNDEDAKNVNVFGSSSMGGIFKSLGCNCMSRDSGKVHQSYAFNSLFSRICTFNHAVLFLKTIGLTLVYYCFSIGITFYQKWFIKDFHFPLTVVICHLIVKFVLSALLRIGIECYTGRSRVLLNWSSYVTQLAATGVVSALDIGFSNWSFEFIPVSLYTMTKSTCIIFILGFSILFGLEKKRWSLIVVIFLISFGLFLFTYKSTQFIWEGFVLVLSASFLGGLRWTLAQLVMQRKELGLNNPLDMIYHIQPWMILGLLPLTIGIEGTSFATTEKVFRYKDSDILVQTLSRILIGSILAFFMEISEYLLLIYTSSLTLSIAGIIKEIFTLILAVKYNGDQISWLNFLGLLVCLTGISLHVVLKALNSQGFKNFSLWRVFSTSYCDKYCNGYKKKHLNNHCLKN